MIRVAPRSCCYEALLDHTRRALEEMPPLLAPDYEVIAALAAVRPGTPSLETPNEWLPLFDLPFTERRNELRRWLGYVFWTRELGDALAARLAARGRERRVEIAAGTGQLTAELMARGLDVVATDNYDQSAAAIAVRRAAVGAAAGARRDEDGIVYPRWVEPHDAWEAVRDLRPDLVLVSWPPLGSGMVPSLLAMPDPPFRALLFLGEPGGCSEAPTHPDELSPGWQMERWEECERFLIGFTDHRLTPDDPAPFRYSRMLCYRRSI